MKKIGPSSKFPKSRLLWYITVGSFLIILVGLALQFRQLFVDQPQPVITIHKFSIYGEFDSSKVRPSFRSMVIYMYPKNFIAAREFSFESDSIWVYRPWVGIVVEISNNGRQPVTIKQFSVSGKYKLLESASPQDISFTNSYYYFAGTRSEQSPLGEEQDVYIQPGQRSIVRLVVMLDLPFDRVARDIFLSELMSKKQVREIFQSLVVSGQDTESRVYKSPDLFAYEPEISMSFPERPYCRLVFFTGTTPPKEMNVLPLKAEQGDVIRP